jgi:hypothetical protein
MTIQVYRHGATSALYPIVTTTCTRVCSVQTVLEYTHRCIHQNITLKQMLEVGWEFLMSI